MKAYIETNKNKGVQILTQARYNAELSPSTGVLYLIVADDSDTALAGEFTIEKAYVGKVEQSIVTDNTGDIIYRTSEVNCTNAAVYLSKIV